MEIEIIKFTEKPNLQSEFIYLFIFLLILRNVLHFAQVWKILLKKLSMAAAWDATKRFPGIQVIHRTNYANTIIQVEMEIPFIVSILSCSLTGKLQKVFCV